MRIRNKLFLFFGALQLALVAAENFIEKTSYSTEIPCSECTCEEKCSSCGVCVNFILDTSCDSMAELRLMKDFIGNLVDEMILSDDRHRFHPFLIINSNGRDIFNLHPSQTSASLRLNEIKVAVNALRPSGSFNLDQALRASSELNEDLGAHCSSKINVIISNGGDGDVRMERFESKADASYLLTLNNWACDRGQKEDCWRAEVVDKLRANGATILNLPVDSHRDYVKTAIVEYVDPCEEKCEEHCTCDCQIDVKNCADDEAQKPCCGKRGEQGATGQKGGRGASGPDGPKGEKGQKGAVGEIGETGRKGPQGPQGAPNDVRGPVGEDGVDGAPGERGEPGPAGYPGSAGEMGPMGHPGDEGDVGLAPPGAKGTKGATGQKGERGRSGPMGPAGAGVGSSSFYDTYKSLLKKSLLESFRKGNVPTSIANKFKKIAEKESNKMCSCNCDLNGRCDRTTSQPSYPQSKQLDRKICLPKKSTAFDNPSVRIPPTVAPSTIRKVYRQPTSNDVVPSKKPAPRKFRRRRFRRKRYHH